MFTRKHYQQIAEILRNAQTTTRAGIAPLPVAHAALLADDMATMFGEDNPRFDRDRFLAAIFEAPGEKTE